MRRPFAIVKVGQELNKSGRVGGVAQLEKCYTEFEGLLVRDSSPVKALSKALYPLFGTGSIQEDRKSSWHN